jgi:hypothetical protein
VRSSRTLALLGATLLLVSCGNGAQSTRGDGAASPGTVQPGTITTPPASETSTDLDRTPVSAADYALYAAMMGGASAMLANLTAEDRAALELEKAVQDGSARATSSNAALLERARRLHEKDVELARLQGVEARYLAIKAKVDAVIGPQARPPAAADDLARENLRYLEAHRDNIERLQRILADPLTRQP